MRKLAFTWYRKYYVKFECNWLQVILINKVSNEIVFWKKVPYQVCQQSASEAVMNHWIFKIQLFHHLAFKTWHSFHMDLKSKIVNKLLLLTFSHFVPPKTTSLDAQRDVINVMCIAVSVLSLERILMVCMFSTKWLASHLLVSSVYTGTGI